MGTRFASDELYDEAFRLCHRGFEIARAAGIENQAGASLMTVADVYRRKGDLEKALDVIRQSVAILEPRDGVAERGRTKAFLNALSREGRILGEDEVVSMGRYQEALCPCRVRSKSPKLGFARMPAMPIAGGRSELRGWCWPMSCGTWIPAVPFRFTIGC